MATRRRIFPVILILVIAGAAAMALRRRAPPPPKFITAAVKRGSIIGRVTATGTLSALVTVQVGSQVSGRIKTLGADFNSKVTKGQLLAKIDPSLFEANLAQARASENSALASVARAQAMLEDADRKNKRNQDLLSQKLVAQQDADTALTTFNTAKADLASARASLEQARANRQQAAINVEYTNILSPVDGTVISRAVDVGQTVAASLQAPTLFTIAENLERMQVDTSVAEADVGKLREGMETTFTVDAYPTRTFAGKVRQIRFAPTTVSNVVTYDAVVDVANPELLLRPGMTANVSFIYARADDVLRLPNAALRFRYDSPGAGDAGSMLVAPSGDGAPRRRPEGRGGESDGGRGGFHRGDDATAGRGASDNVPPKPVWVLADAGPTRALVKLGVTDGTYSQIVDGTVAEGSEVIVDRQDSEARPGGSGQAPRQQAPGGTRRMF